MRLNVPLFAVLALAIATISVATITVAPSASVQASAVPVYETASQVSPSCNTVISDYVNWARQGGKMVDSQMVGLTVKTRDPNARHEHKFGRWAFARLDASGGSLHGYYQEFFSDRLDGRQRFDKDADDWLEVTISPDDGITIKLLSWGGGVTKLTNVYCSSDGFIVARWPGAWEQALMFVLVKTYE